MNGKKARAIRKMIGCDLSASGDGKESRMVQVAVANYGIIDGVNGDHRVEERPVYHSATNQDRYLYRTLKKIYSNAESNPVVKKGLIRDIKSHKGGKL